MTAPLAFELAVQDPYGIWAATQVVPDRIELCTALDLGGLTPSVGLIEAAVRAQLNVHVLIRPRAGDFEFDHHAIEVMHSDIDQALAAGAHGVVVGASLEGALHREFISDVVQQVAGRAEITVHRVIDVVKAPDEDIEWLASSGVRRILTSGAENTAIAGLKNLERYASQWAGSLEIMAGGGVQVADVPALARSGVHAIHSSAKKEVSGSSGVALGSQAGHGAMVHHTTDIELAREMKQAVHHG